MESHVRYKQSDDYYAAIADKYRALISPDAVASSDGNRPEVCRLGMAGDAKTVRPRLDKVGLPVEVFPAASLGAR